MALVNSKEFSTNQRKFYNLALNECIIVKRGKNRFSLFIILSFITCFSFAQTRNLKLVKPPVENPTNQQRKAIVIGMSNYGGNMNLLNTINDANDMSKALTQIGFEVTLLTDNDKQTLKTNLAKWYSSIKDNDMAVFYYSGHGMEVGGNNYLIPVGFDGSSLCSMDARVRTVYLDENTLNVNQVLNYMDAEGVSAKLLILDACRDNPFTSGCSRGYGEKKGLAGMDGKNGTYIAFSAAPGTEAQDGGNLHNGVFTYYLKQEILTQGASWDDIFGNVATEVKKHTSNEQSPFRNTDLGKIYFIPPGNNPPNYNPTLVTTKYYYYVDQNNKESQKHFDSRENAMSEMKNNNLYGKIYSNMGEMFVVDKPAPVNNPAPAPVENLFANYTETKNDLNIEMVAVQGGTFTMGSCTSENLSDCINSYKTRVTVSDFYIGKYEVTQAQWKAVMGVGSNPSYFKGDNLPVEQVGLKDIQEFISALNSKTGKKYRLPTEAEWEFAMRGGNKSKEYKYSGSNNPFDVAWFVDNSGQRTHPVGTKAPNELGIYDMSGNIMEWCNDWWGNRSSNPQTNPQGPTSGSNRIIRGGSWVDYANNLTVWWSSSFPPTLFFNYNGFRLACSAK